LYINLVINLFWIPNKVNKGPNASTDAEAEILSPCRKKNLENQPRLWPSKMQQ
jgi:hypothetical protein